MRVRYGALGTGRGAVPQRGCAVTWRGCDACDLARVSPVTSSIGRAPNAKDVSTDVSQVSGAAEEVLVANRVPAHCNLPALREASLRASRSGAHEQWAGDASGGKWGQRLDGSRDA